MTLKVSEKTGWFKTAFWQIFAISKQSLNLQSSCFSLLPQMFWSNESMHCNACITARGVRTLMLASRFQFCLRGAFGLLSATDKGSEKCRMFISQSFVLLWSSKPISQGVEGKSQGDVTSSSDANRRRTRTWTVWLKLWQRSPGRISCFGLVWFGLQPSPYRHTTSLSLFPGSPPSPWKSTLLLGASHSVRNSPVRIVTWEWVGFVKIL